TRRWRPSCPTRSTRACSRRGCARPACGSPSWTPCSPARTSIRPRWSAAPAAATAQLRVRTLGQLRALRERYRIELDEVHELIAQLVAQAELVRLQPSIAPASGELVRELVAQIESLDD